jgi:uncharacterized integral membrane protein
MKTVIICALNEMKDKENGMDRTCSRHARNEKFVHTFSWKEAFFCMETDGIIILSMVFILAVVSTNTVQTIYFPFAI